MSIDKGFEGIRGVCNFNGELSAIAFIFLKTAKVLTAYRYLN
jgi:hypothetical protein